MCVQSNSYDHDGAAATKNYNFSAAVVFTNETMCDLLRILKFSTLRLHPYGCVYRGDLIRCEE